VRVLVVQRSLSPPGGGNAVAAWMIQALLDQHQVASLTIDAWSAKHTNAFYGTAIPEGAVTRHVLPAAWRWLSAVNAEHLTQLKMAALLREARMLAPDYDILICVDNFATFARPGLQYVHFPARMAPPPEYWHGLVRRYFALCDRVRGLPWEDARKNQTLVNSRWTGEHLVRLGEIAAPIVLYPPVISPGEGLPWEERDDTFLCVGRFHPSKRIETAMAIVDRARQQAVPGARLIVAGSVVDARYAQQLRARAASYGDWIRIHVDLPRHELNALICRSRYGVQAMVGEHFGMATAEMAAAGCLVFAHHSGGSPEVLNDEAALLWQDEPDAAARIVTLVNDPSAIAALRDRLRQHARRFDTASFIERFRTIVAG
jgi:glycosyltransferase involved in cell wall biosynthesis